jgi:hypothetical protein
MRMMLMLIMMLMHMLRMRMMARTPGSPHAQDPGMLRILAEGC